MRVKSRLLLLAAVFSLFFGATGVGLMMDEEDNDPDRPPGIHGPFDEAEYIKAREAFIALRRGNDPSKPIDGTARQRAVEMMDRQVAELQRMSRGPTRKNSPDAFPNWVELGPNPIPLGQTSGGRTNVSGRVSAIEIDPTNPDIVYVGAAQGGVYRTTDGGTTWTPIFDSALTLSIGALALDYPNNSLFVGTGEANGSGDSFAGVGIYRINSPATTATLTGPYNPPRHYIDADGNPQSAPAFNGRGISKILIPEPFRLLVGVAGGVIGIGANPPFGNSIPPLAMRGLYKLDNCGGPVDVATITRIPVSTTDTGQGLCLDSPCTVNRSVNDMVLDRSDPTGNTVIVWLNGLNTAGDGGIYRSTNVLSASPTFTQTLITTSTTTSNGRGQFAIAQLGAGNPARVYIASGEPSNVPAGATLCNSSSSFGSLRRSTDGGVTWSAKLAGGGGFCGGQCFYNIGFDLLPGATLATDKLLLGGNVTSGACARQESTSLDGAATAFTAHDSQSHADTHVIKIAPSNSSIVYRGDDGGIWKSTDGGNSFAPLNNATFRATQFQSIAVHPTDQDITIGGTQDNGTEAITAAGPVWLHADDGDGGFAMIDQSTPTTMYHTYFNQLNSQIGYSRSLTGGALGTWSFLGCSGTGTSNGVACSSATTTAVNFYCPTALGPGSPNNTVYIGTDRLLRSATQGTANVTVSQAPIQAGVAVSSIGISQLDDNYRIVGLNNGAIWYTTTGSSTLTSLDPVGGGSIIPDFYVARLVFDPTDKNTVYITLGNYANGVAHTQSHVWKITNLNTTPVLTGINGAGAFKLPDVPINGFAVDPTQTTRLFAGTDIGVYVTEDGGTNWRPYGTGLPRVAVFDMAIQNVKRVVRIATHGRGMWEIPIPPFSLDSLYKSFPGNTVGNGSVNVTGPNGPTWTATTVDGWIHITNAGPGTGNGTVTYTVDVNPNTNANRSGTIMVAGQPYTVYQGAAFVDVDPANPFYDDIGRLSARGITVGCSGGGSNFCPNGTVTREQMAAFIIRSLGEFSPPTPGSQRFTDVPPANVFYNFIDRLAALGITVGCNPPTNTMYCPSSGVTREQMSAFIIRALGEFDPPTPGSQRFNDVPPANVFYNFIDRMAVLNITLGCTPDHLFYCPSDPVIRAQMSAFLVRAFNL
jgi:photosystem II stability/assembly factor-like uncharacterized protein